MQTANKPLFNRSDTFFGVCEGLGTDIGLNPNLFRLGFAGLLFWNPILCVATYFGLGVVVYAMRWLMPERTAHGEDDQAAASEPTASNDAENLVKVAA